MRLGKDTKETVLFITGLLGICSQAVAVMFGEAVSYPLLVLYGAMCGLPSVFAIDEKRGSKDE
jgi:hypothetical protein